MSRVHWGELSGFLTLRDPDTPRSQAGRIAAFPSVALVDAPRSSAAAREKRFRSASVDILYESAFLRSDPLEGLRPPLPSRAAGAGFRKLKLRNRSRMHPAR